MKESEVQKEIKDMLDSHPLVAHCHTTTTGMLRGIKQSNKIIKVGFPGLSDIIGQLKTTGKRHGGFFALEVKTGRNKATQAQLDFIELVNKNGGTAGVVHSIKEALELIE